MLKKILALLLAVALVLSLVSCGKKGNNVDTDNKIKTEDEKKNEILRLCANFDIKDYKGYDYSFNQKVGSAILNTKNVEMTLDTINEKATKTIQERKLNNDIFGDQYIVINTVKKIKDGYITTIIDGVQQNTVLGIFDDFVNTSIKKINIDRTWLEKNTLNETSQNELVLEVKDQNAKELLQNNDFFDLIITIKTDSNIKELINVKLTFSGKNSSFEAIFELKGFAEN